jgi:hypothetical protein
MVNTRTLGPVLIDACADGDGQLRTTTDHHGLPRTTTTDHGPQPRGAQLRDPANGTTALIQAATFGHTNIVRMLLEAHALQHCFIYFVSRPRPRSAAPAPSRHGARGLSVVSKRV